MNGFLKQSIDAIIHSKRIILARIFKLGFLKAIVKFASAIQSTPKKI